MTTKKRIKYIPLDLTSRTKNVYRKKPTVDEEIKTQDVIMIEADQKRREVRIGSPLYVKRLEYRTRQIDIGKKTVSYQNYVTLIPKQNRTDDDPKTPRITIKSSKRSFDGLVHRWRYLLHRYDTPGQILQIPPYEDKDKELELDELELGDSEDEGADPEAASVS